MWQYNYTSDYLCHWGIKGQKWGIRRYQNPDGTLTPAGKKRYAKEKQKEYDKTARTAYKKYVSLNDEKRQEVVPNLTSKEKETIIYGAQKDIKRGIAVGSLVGGPIGGALATSWAQNIADYYLKDIGSSSKGALTMKTGQKMVDDILKIDGDIVVAKSTVDKIDKKDYEWVYIPR